MVMNAIARAANDNHELVYAYHQGAAEYNYKDIGPWGNVRNGYCAALTFQWCQARLSGGDLPYSSSTHMAEKADWRVTRLHNLSKSDMLGYDATMRELGLVRGAATSLAGAPDAVRITNQVAGATGALGREVVSVIDVFRGIDEAVGYGTASGMPPNDMAARASLDWFEQIEPDAGARTGHVPRDQARAGPSGPHEPGCSFRR